MEINLDINMTKPSVKKDPALRQLIHDHAWNHFRVNSQQRIDLFKYYIITVSIIVAGFYHLAEVNLFSDLTTPSFLVALSLFIITGAFHAIDKRNLQFINRSKQSLIGFENEFIEQGKYKIFSKKNINQKSSDNLTEDKPEEHLGIGITHTNSFLIMWLLGYVISVGWVILFFINNKIWLYNSVKTIFLYFV